MLFSDKNSVLNLPLPIYLLRQHTLNIWKLSLGWAFRPAAPMYIPSRVELSSLSFLVSLSNILQVMEVFRAPSAILVMAVASVKLLKK